MQARPLKTGVEQIVRAQIKGFYTQNFGINAEHVYLPTELFDLFTDYLEEEVERLCRLSGSPVPNFDLAYRYWYLGAEIHNTNGFDIIVTRDPLP